MYLFSFPLLHTYYSLHALHPSKLFCTSFEFTPQKIHPPPPCLLFYFYTYLSVSPHPIYSLSLSSFPPSPPLAVYQINTSSVLLLRLRRLRRPLPLPPLPAPPPAQGSGPGPPTPPPSPHGTRLAVPQAQERRQGQEDIHAIEGNVRPRFPKFPDFFFKKKRRKFGSRCMLSSLFSSPSPPSLLS